MKATYKEYIKLYNSKANILLRAILKKIENDCGSHGIEDSHVHNNVVRYFNDEALHKKYTKKEFNQKLKQNSCEHTQTIVITTYYSKAKLYECVECEHQFIK